MTFLHIETSTNVCSVALSNNGSTIFSIANNDGQNHAAMLSLFIQQAIEKAAESNLKLDAVAVSEGPGSYTGLRIGVSTAKGLCYGYEIPLIAVNTLEILCTEAVKKQSIEENALLCPMIDARRMEVYTAIYTSSLNLKQDTTPEIITEKSFADFLEKNTVYFLGNGAEKCSSVITHTNARFIANVEPLAENMIMLAEKKYRARDFADVAYFEPFYLKEFQATTPKKLF